MIRHFDITRHQADHGATLRPFFSPLAVRNKDEIARCRLIEACEASNPKIARPDQFAAQAYTGVQLLAEAADDANLAFDDIAADLDAYKQQIIDGEIEVPTAP